MGLYYYSIGLPSVKTILWHYRPLCTAVKNLLFKLKSVLTTCLLAGMAWLAWFTGRTERPDGWSVGRSFSTGPLLSLSSLEALHSVPKCLVFTIQIGNTTNSAGLNIGMLGI